MQSKKGSTDARIHAARNDSDRGAAARGGAQLDWVTLDWVTQAEPSRKASRIEAELRAQFGAEWLARQKAQWKTAAGN